MRLPAMGTIMRRKLEKPCQLHNSHWGMMCPAETTEGHACGLVKNLALMVYITVGSAANPILEFLEEWGTKKIEEISPAVIPQAAKIFVNGCWVGIHRNPDPLVKTLRRLRRQNEGLKQTKRLVYQMALMEIGLNLSELESGLNLSDGDQADAVPRRDRRGGRAWT
ncbi:DNA-directed RNA polymerase II subunit RPB2 [Hordeum vulgare]|nr:DNA-directed RNA polymerase II subunit RPB2 [Hordeum vulgare]